MLFTAHPDQQERNIMARSAPSTILFLSLVAVVCRHQQVAVTGFSSPGATRPPSPVFGGPRTSLPPLFESTSTSSLENISCISVCTSDLCQCQGDFPDGGASDALVAALRSKLDSKVPVEEVGCLGNCGMGTMVAIDFSDGGCALVNGLEETLVELGMTDETSNVPVDEQSAACPAIEAATRSVPAEKSSSETSSLTAAATSDSQTIVTPLHDGPDIGVKKEIPVPTPQEESVQTTHNAVERMRAERAAAASTEEQTSPWGTMASYLAKKATEKIFGEGSS